MELGVFLEFGLFVTPYRRQQRKDSRLVPLAGQALIVTTTTL